MRYGVVICTKCKTVQGVALRYQTAGCKRCGRRMRIKDMALFFETDSEKELAEGVGLINAERKGGKSVYLDHLRRFESKTQLNGETEGDKIVEEVVKRDDGIVRKSDFGIAKKWKKVLLVMRELAGEKDFFTEDGLRTALEEKGMSEEKERVEEYIRRFLDTDVIYEPKAGRYKLLE